MILIRKINYNNKKSKLLTELQTMIYLTRAAHRVIR